jgi:hypothetical protein
VTPAFPSIAAAISAAVRASYDAEPLPFGWTRKENLILVCCQCVKDGDVLAPPGDLRTDGLCPKHFTETMERIAAR